MRRCRGCGRQATQDLLVIGIDEDDDGLLNWDAVKEQVSSSTVDGLQGRAVALWTSQGQ